MLRSSLLKSKSQGSQRNLWGLFVAINVLLIVDEMQLVGQNVYLVFFLIRLALSFVAVFAATAIYFKKPISGDFLSLYTLFLIAVGACFSLFQPSEMILRLSINAFFYLLLAASFKGTLRDWLQIYFPVASFLLFAPIGLKANFLMHFENLYFVVASLACSNGIVLIRRYVSVHSGANPEDEAVIQDQKEKNMSPFEAAGEVMSNNRMFLSEEQDLGHCEVLKCRDLITAISEMVQAKKLQFKTYNKTQISIQSPRSGPEGLGVVADEKDLRLIVGQLIDEAVESLGMQTGFVRLSVQLTQRQLLVIIEDNGRGLGKDIIARLKAKNRLELSSQNSSQAPEAVLLAPREMQSLLRFWGADFEVITRLGVGRRVCMNFPLTALAIEEMIRPLEGFSSYDSSQAGLSH